MKKKLWALGTAIAVMLLAFFWMKGSFEPKRTPIYAALAELPGFNLKEVKGQYFVLHFWAKWCEPCADEIPHLVEFAAKAQFAKPLKILAVSLDQNLEESKQILPDHGTKLPPNFLLALDADHHVAEKLGSFQYPETYFIDEKGEVIEKWVGAQKWGKPEVFDFFKAKVL